VLLEALQRSGAIGEMEIITGIERRRRWRVEDKLRIVAEAEQPGACFAEVARRNEVSRGLLWNWRSQVRRGKLTVASFLPVQVVNGATVLEPQPPLPRTSSLTAAVAGRIEITLPDGSHVQVDSTVSLAALRRVVTVLRG
jgi:ferric-dicitrate binding protein FerR (iron transport regulator)